MKLATLAGIAKKVWIPAAAFLAAALYYIPPTGPVHWREGVVWGVRAALAAVGVTVVGTSDAAKAAVRSAASK